LATIPIDAYIAIKSTGHPPQYELNTGIKKLRMHDDLL
jgi:hypothetical protein